MMPGMDGFEVCRALKAEPETRDTAVIFMSARGEVSDKVSGLELGAVDYITKPIQAEEVLARVATHLSRQHLERELRASRDRLDRELAGAARMQRLILPPAMPEHPRVSFAAYYETSRHAGGDYYDVLAARRRPLRDHGRRRLGPWRALRDRDGDDPRRVAHLSRRAPTIRRPCCITSTGTSGSCGTPSMYATAVYGVLDAGRGTLRAVLRRPSAAAPAAPGEAASPAADRSDDVLDLGRAARDSVRRAGAPTRRSRRVLHRRHHRTPGPRRLDVRPGPVRRRADAHRRCCRPPTIVADIVAEVDRFAGGHEPEDDQTLLVAGFD